MTDYRQVAIAAAKAAGIDPNIFVAQIQQESGFNPNAKSSAGAEGIAQFMPGTAKGMGVNPWDPVASLYAAARLDANNLHAYGGDWAKALAAYNAGGGSVNSWVSKFGSNWLSHAFPETQNYVKTILGNKTSTGQSGTSMSGTFPNNPVPTDQNPNGFLNMLGISASGFQQFLLVVFGGLVVVIGLFFVVRKKEAAQ